MNNPILIFALIISGAVLYYGAFALELRKKKTAAMILWLAGVGVNLVTIVNNYAINGYVPFVSMFQVLIFLAVCFFPIYCYVNYVGKCKGCETYFMIASAIVMTGPVFMDKNALWTFPPALNSPWFVPHILVYMISYSLAVVAFLMVVSGLVKGEGANSKSVYLCVRCLFPFMTCGMFFGAIWATQVWGDFWSFDIKECWSLVAWLTYMVYLHCYRKASLKKYCPVLAILGFVFVVVTFFFANVVGGSDSMHTYS